MRYFINFFVSIFFLMIMYILDENTPDIFKKICIYFLKNNNIFILKFIQWSPVFIKNKTIQKSLQHLQENCLQHDISYTKNIFKKNNINIDDYFIFFDSVPIASATIGQVYKGKLKTGEIVAVKVKHPDIENQIIESSIWFDYYLNILDKLIKLINKNYSIKLDFDRFKLSIQEECNFVNESNNLKFFYNIYKNSDFIIPKVIDNSNDYIIMTYEDGVHFDNINNTNGFIFIKLLIFFLYNFLYYDLAYTDFHYGNLRIKNNKIVIYDFGNIFKTNNKIYNLYFYLICIQRNYLELLDMLLIYSNNEFIYDNYINVIDELNTFIEFIEITNKKVTVDDLISIMVKNNINIDFSLLLILKSMITTNLILEDYNIIDFSLSYIDRTNKFIDLIKNQLEFINIENKSVFFDNILFIKNNLNNFVFYDKFNSIIKKFKTKNGIINIENHLNSIYNLFIINGLSEDILDNKLNIIKEYIDNDAVFDKFYDYLMNNNSEPFLKQKWNLLNKFMFEQSKIKNIIKDINEDNNKSIFNKIIKKLKNYKKLVDSEL